MCVSPEAMLALLQREGTEEYRMATLEHVRSCPACHREYERPAAQHSERDRAMMPEGLERVVQES